MARFTPWMKPSPSRATIGDLHLEEECQDQCRSNRQKSAASFYASFFGAFWSPPPSLLPDSCSVPGRWQVCAIIMQPNLAEEETGRAAVLWFDHLPRPPTCKPRLMGVGWGQDPQPLTDIRFSGLFEAQLSPFGEGGRRAKDLLTPAWRASGRGLCWPTFCMLTPRVLYCT